jgi:type I restriction enzyme M protein
MGTLIDRTHRDLASIEIDRIASAYHRWKGTSPGVYRDEDGFCHSATLEEIRQHRYALVPGRYVGFPPAIVPAWRPQELQLDIEMMRQRVDEISDASSMALQLIEKLLNG